MMAGARHSLYDSDGVRDTPLAERITRPRHMTAGARRMGAQILLTICYQHSAKRGPPHDGGRNVIWCPSCFGQEGVQRMHVD